MARCKKVTNAGSIAHYALNDRILRSLDPSQLPDLLFQYPPYAEGVRIKCDCGTEASPPWRQKIPYEAGSFEGENDSIHILGSIALMCKVCGKNKNLEFPESKGSLGYLTLYGDESSQWFGDKYGFLYCYAFVGFEKEAAFYVQHELEKTKRILRPFKNPRSWTLHAYELRSPEWRLKNGVSFTTPEIDNILFGLATLIGTIDERRVYTTVIPPVDAQIFAKNGKIENNVRQLALTCALYGSTFHATQEGFHLAYILEAQTKDHERNSIDFFVENIARGMRYDLSYHWSCHRKFVALPKTIGKGVYWQLEISDLIAFATRRYFYRVNQHLDPEIPLEMFGSITWGTITNSPFRTYKAVGFPADYFWPDVTMGPNFY